MRAHEEIDENLIKQCLDKNLCIMFGSISRILCYIFENANTRQKIYFFLNGVSSISPLVEVLSSLLSNKGHNKIRLHSFLESFVASLKDKRRCKVALTLFSKVNFSKIHCKIKQLCKSNLIFWAPILSCNFILFSTPSALC